MRPRRCKKQRDSEHHFVHEWLAKHILASFEIRETCFSKSMTMWSQVRPGNQCRVATPVLEGSWPYVKLGLLPWFCLYRPREVFSRAKDKFAGRRPCKNLLKLPSRLIGERKIMTYSAESLLELVTRLSLLHRLICVPETKQAHVFFRPRSPYQIASEMSPQPSTVAAEILAGNLEKVSQKRPRF